jgi:hypothetical protein
MDRFVGKLKLCRIVAGHQYNTVLLLSLHKIPEFRKGFGIKV